MEPTSFPIVGQTPTTQMSAPPPYPVSECVRIVTVSQPSTATARLVEAVQRQDITREDIARTVCMLTAQPALHSLAAEFLDVSRGRQTVHRFCNAVGAVDANCLEQTCHALIYQQVSHTEAMAAQREMQEQRDRSRMRLQRNALVDEARFER